MTVLIHDGPLLSSISRWGETLNDTEEMSDKKIKRSEHAYYIDGLDESGKPITVDVRHILADGFHEYFTVRSPEQKFFFEGRRVPFYACVLEDYGPRKMLAKLVHICQIWKDPLFQRNCRGFATKFAFKLLDENKLVTNDYAETWDGMNLCLNCLQRAIDSQKYNLYYAIADRKFDDDGNEIPLKRYLIKVETIADVYTHYTQHILGDDPVFVYRLAVATVKGKPVESIIADPEITEIVTCQEAEDKGLFKYPQPFERWPKVERKKFSQIYVDM